MFASIYETIQHSFEIDSVNLSLFLQICFACMSYGYCVLVPLGRKIKGSAKQQVNEDDKKFPYIVL